MRLNQVVVDTVRKISSGFRRLLTGDQGGLVDYHPACGRYLRNADWQPIDMEICYELVRIPTSPIQYSSLLKRRIRSRIKHEGGAAAASGLTSATLATLCEKQHLFF